MSEALEDLPREEEREEEDVGDSMIDFLNDFDDDDDEVASKPLSAWQHTDCVAWLKSVAISHPDWTLDCDSAEREQLTGELLLQALESTRELKETFGLTSMSARLGFEEAVRALAQPASVLDSASERVKPKRPDGAVGGLYDPAFLEVTRGLYDMHMGVENMAPLLYTLLRFIKPKQVVEIGAGYTSVFILQALKDNADEMKNYRRLHAAGQCFVESGERKVPWCVDTELECHGYLHCVDNMQHAHTTAHKVVEAAEELGLEDHLKLRVADAWKFNDQLEDDSIDFMWCAPLIASYSHPI
jgi:hypothetical protein